jgi:hypothetical protein
LTAAALHTRGHGIIADDIVPINFDHGSIAVWPGFPQLKLSPDAALSLGFEVDSLLFLHPLLKEQAYRSTDGFPQTPLPLRCIYVLAEGERQVIEPLQPQAGLLKLLCHSYGVQSLQKAIDSSLHLLQCAKLVKEIPIYCLQRPNALWLLPDLARMVEEHLAHDV